MEGHCSHAKDGREVLAQRSPGRHPLRSAFLRRQLSRPQQVVGDARRLSDFRSNFRDFPNQIVSEARGFGSVVLRVRFHLSSPFIKQVLGFCGKKSYVLSGPRPTQSEQPTFKPIDWHVLRQPKLYSREACVQVHADERNKILSD
jgi:hypothetical protein